MRKLKVLFPTFLFLCTASNSQFIDMHLHGYTDKGFWVGGRNGLLSSKTPSEHLQQTIQKMDQHNIRYAVVCGRMQSIEHYTNADKRFIQAYQDYDDTLLPVQQFEEQIKKGNIKVFGEVMAVYKGRTLAVSMYKPYLCICKKYGLPVA